MHVIEQITDVRSRSNKIDEHESTTHPADTDHLGHSPLRITELVQRATAEHHIKRLVDERQGLGVPLLQQDVADPSLPQPLRTEPE
jgi:hypothetical protein